MPESRKTPAPASVAKPRAEAVALRKMQSTGGRHGHRMRKNGSTVLFDSERKRITPREMERLLQVVQGSRFEARDHCLLLLMFRHGLRVFEACGLKLDQVDTESCILHIGLNIAKREISAR